MNKQLVSFLSLFSLVLVLAIYYVMLPFSSNNLGDINNVPVINEQEDETEAYFVSLELQKTEAYEELIDEQESILASSTSTAEEKACALQEIARLEELMGKESEAVAAIVDAGYPAAYVETYDQGIKVVVYKDDATKQDAAVVMGLIIDEFGMELMPEIRFYS